MNVLSLFLYGGKFLEFVYMDKWNKSDNLFIY